MRITNSMMTTSFLRDMNNNLENMKTIQGQMTSGKEIRKPSDDPSRVARAMQLTSDLNANTQYGKNIDDTTNWLNTTDTALGQVGDVLQRVRELLISAGDASYGSDERGAIKNEINQRVGEITQDLNTNFDGSYIFGGSNGDTKPIVQGVDVNGNTTFSYCDSNGVKTNNAAQINMINQKLPVEISQGVTLNYNVTAGDVLNLVSTAGTSAAKTAVIAAGQAAGATAAGVAVTAAAAVVPAWTAAQQAAAVTAASAAAAAATAAGASPAAAAAAGANIIGDIVGGLTPTAAATQEAKAAALSVAGMTAPQATAVGAAAGAAVGATTPVDAATSAATTTASTLVANVSTDLPTIFQNITHDLDTNNVANLTGQDLSDITDAINNLLKVRSDVGAKVNRMDSAKSKNTDESTNMTELLSTTEDIDITEKTMEYANVQTVYTASLETGAKIMQPSLLDYLK